MFLPVAVARDVQPALILGKLLVIRLGRTLLVAGLAAPRPPVLTRLTAAACSRLTAAIRPGWQPPDAEGPHHRFPRGLVLVVAGERGGVAVVSRHDRDIQKRIPYLPRAVQDTHEVLRVDVEQAAHERNHTDGRPVLALVAMHKHVHQVLRAEYLDVSRTIVDQLLEPLTDGREGLAPC